MRARGRRRLGGAVLGVVLMATGVAAEPDPADPVDRLVERVYFEGIPYGEVRVLGPDAVHRLAGVLGDPDRAEHHANAVLALGILGAPGAYEALVDWSEGPGSGELDRHGFRARRALPHAMGHLAATDARALSWLTARAQPSTPAAWSFASLGAGRLASLERRGAALGLALSGRPAARSELERMAALPEAAADPTLQRALQDALALHAVVSRRGIEAALPSGGISR